VQSIIIMRQPLPSADPTVGEVISLYLQLEATPRKEAARNKDAWDTVHRVLRDFDRAHGTLRISECRKAHLKLFIEGNPRLKTGWSKAGQCGIVQRCFNWAADDMDVIQRNPFKGVRFAKGSGRRRLTDEEFAAALAHAGPALARVLRFCRYTGCRPAEMSGARWSDLRSEPGACWLELAQHKTVEKTGKPRLIPLPRIAVEIIVEITPNEGQEFIFLNRRGRPWRKNALCMAWAKVRKLAGLPADAFLYGTRHSHVSGGIENGVPLADMAKLENHTDPKMTAHYDHSRPDMQALCRLAEQAVANLKAG